MRSSYKNEDVALLLKDITGLVEPQPTKERERLIQSGRHYCEMLPIEYVPTEKYMQAYEEALRVYAAPTAVAVANLADKILQKRGREAVLVSLARAGTPIGILLKRYIRQRYRAKMPHYSISIIRGRGIDRNAMRYLLERYEPRQLLFVDGWIGKGAILQELKKEVAAYAGVSPDIAVLADPANATDLCGTHEDILIPSSCLNCTVSGLISRTFLRSDVIGENDFHGAVYYGELEQSDLSYAFIQAIEKHFPKKHFPFEATRQGNLQEGTVPGISAEENAVPEAGLQENAVPGSGTEENVVPGSGLEENAVPGTSAEKNAVPGSGAKENVVPGTGMEEVGEIARAFGISDIHFIKPGIGETTRVLLRRVPWKVLVDRRWKDGQALRHILRLAREKNVPVEVYPLRHYKCCGLIKKLADV